MIGYLNGVFYSRHDPLIIISVNGVGYKVNASSEVLSKFKTGDKIEIFIHTHVREDTLELYGFINEESLALFENLLNVSGIGPKTALGIFSLGNSQEIISAIQKANVDFFTSAPRLGKKNAQKIIIELKNKLGSLESLDLNEENDEVYQALSGFGFNNEEIRNALGQLQSTDNWENKKTAEKIKLALRYLGK